MQSALVCNAVSFISQQAVTCLNDEELPMREREFRSQYQSDLTTQTTVPEQSLMTEGPILAVGGVVMFLAAIFLAWRGTQRAHY